jgi:hypothetical protein
MNGQTVIEKTIPSGGTVRITIDDDGFVIIEGARRANIIYGFYFDGTGYHRDSAISLPGTENSDYIAIHTEHAHDGVTAEFSAKVGTKYPWWSSAQRAAMRLLPISMMGRKSFFRLQFRRGGQSQFEMADEKMLHFDKAA